MRNKLQVAFALCALLAVAPGPAVAAHFTTQPPPTSKSGAGPFYWSFTSDSSGLYGDVAYKFSTESEWNRCSRVRNVNFSNLPDGTYTMLIADDVSLNFAASEGLLYSGLTAPCSQEPKQEPRSAITTGTLVIDSAPSVPPPAKYPTPPKPVTTTGPSSGSVKLPPAQSEAGCALAMQLLKKARVRRNVAERRYSQARTLAEYKEWAKKARRANIDVKKAQRQVVQAC